MISRSLFFSCGCQLSADELYKVDKTVLAEILSAEMSSGDVSAKKETESLAAPELVTHEVQEEDEGEEQLEELLEASNDSEESALLWVHVNHHYLI